MPARWKPYWYAVWMATKRTTVREELAVDRNESTPYRIASRPMGLRSDIDLTHALALADAIEDEEIARKLEQSSRESQRDF
jgi:hypothetical protein